MLVRNKGTPAQLISVDGVHRSAKCFVKEVWDTIYPNYTPANEGISIEASSVLIERSNVCSASMYELQRTKWFNKLAKAFKITTAFMQANEWNVPVDDYTTEQSIQCKGYECTRAIENIFLDIVTIGGEFVTIDYEVRPSIVRSFTIEKSFKKPVFRETPKNKNCEWIYAAYCPDTFKREFFNLSKIRGVRNTGSNLNSYSS